MKQGYQPEPSGIENPTPPSTGSNVEGTILKKQCKRVGIPLTEVGQRLQGLHDAIKKNNMAIAADAQYNLELLEPHDDMVKCVTMTVYFFEK